MANQATEAVTISPSYNKKSLKDRSKKSDDCHVHLMFSVQFIFLSLVKHHKPPILRLD
jgi:hypothetical protein